VSADVPLSDGTDLDAAQGAMGNSSSLGDTIVSNVAAVPGIDAVAGNISSGGVLVETKTRPAATIVLFRTTEFDGFWSSSAGQVVEVTDGYASFDNTGRYPIISTNGNITMMGLTASEIITDINITWTGGENGTVYWYRMASTTSSTISTTTTFATKTVTTQPPCSCIYQNSWLPKFFYDGTTFANEIMVKSYGTNCSVWDSMEGTPWYGLCPVGADFCSSTFNWCSIPWCYVDPTCYTAHQTVVFYPNDLYYSYDACGAPDCYGDFSNAGCPYDPNGDCVSDGLRMATTINNVNFDALVGALLDDFTLALKQALAADLSTTLGTSIDATTVVVTLSQGSVSAQLTVPVTGVDLAAASSTLSGSSSLGSAIASSVSNVPGINAAATGVISASNPSITVHTPPPPGSVSVFRVQTLNGPWSNDAAQTVTVADGYASFDNTGRYPIISTNGVITMMGMTAVSITLNTVDWSGGGSTDTWIRLAATTTTTTTTTGRPCPSAPTVYVARSDNSHCANQPSGYRCWPQQCPAGYTWIGGNVTCVDGTYEQEGDCIFQDFQNNSRSQSATMQARTASVLIHVRHPDPTVPSHTDWANDNVDPLTEASADMLGVDSRLVRCRPLDDDERRRRLEGILPEDEGAAPRELSSYNNVLMRLHVMLLLDQPGLPSHIDGSNDAQVTALLTEFASSHSSSFWNRTRTIVEASGATMPQVLTECRVFAQTPRVRATTVVVVPRWDVAPWGPCSSGCGYGFRMRITACSTGANVHCDATLVAGARNRSDDFERPPSSETCRDYGQCDGSFLCPGGPDENGDCSAQAGGIIAALLAVAGCCCIGCFFFVKRNLQPVSEGNAKIDNVVGADGQQDQAKFRVEKNADGHHKTHVIWDIDLALTQARLGLLPLQREEARLRAAEENADPVRVEIDKLIATPCFAAGTEVECFGMTTPFFLLGEITGSKFEDKGYFTFDVLLADGQVRKDVGIENLRMPIKVGEAVDILTSRGTVKRSKIHGCHVTSGHGIVYTTKKGMELSQKLSSAIARRSFSKGEEVDVYVGPQGGWVPCFVSREESTYGDLHGQDVQPTDKLKVSILGADIHHRATGRLDPYCVVSMDDNPDVAFKTVRLSKMSGSSQHDGELWGYEVGADLVFDVFDSDAAEPSSENDRILGRATLPCSKFFPDGWHGDLDLHDDTLEGSTGTSSMKVFSKKAGKIRVQIGPPVSTAFLQMPVQVRKHLQDDHSKDVDDMELMRDDTGLIMGVEMTEEEAQRASVAAASNALAMIPEGAGCYLPKFYHHIQVMVPVPKQPFTWKADNSKLKSTHPGVAYRRSRSMDDRVGDELLLKWGDTVEATDLGNGWLKIITQAEGNNADNNAENNVVNVDGDEVINEQASGPPLGLAGQWGTGMFSEDLNTFTWESGMTSTVKVNGDDIELHQGSEVHKGKVDGSTIVWSDGDVWRRQIWGVLQVIGAGGVGQVLNGTYKPAGTHCGKPKYAQVDGQAIIYFSPKGWKLNYRDKCSGWYYKHADVSSGVPPQGQWSTDGYPNGDADPAPFVSYDDEAYHRGDPVLVYSTSAKAWCPGNIVRVASSGFTVRYHVPGGPDSDGEEEMEKFLPLGAGEMKRPGFQDNADPEAISGLPSPRDSTKAPPEEDLLQDGDRSFLRQFVRRRGTQHILPQHTDEEEEPVIEV
jgi:hypothetical protein